jgi:hypothetical protein
MPRWVALFETAVARAGQSSSNDASGKHSTTIRPRIGLRQALSSRVGDRALLSVLGRRHLARTDATRSPAHLVVDALQREDCWWKQRASSLAGSAGDGNRPRRTSASEVLDSRVVERLGAHGCGQICPARRPSRSSSRARSARRPESSRQFRANDHDRGLTAIVPPCGESERPAGAPPAVAPIQTL